MSAAPTNVADPSVDAETTGVPAPRLRRGTIGRERLLRTLGHATEVPLVLVRAPAGYGKTTLLRQWSQRDARPFVWMPSGADDPLERALATLRSLPEAAVAVIDDADIAGEAQRMRSWSRTLPVGSQLAIATRAEPSLPLGSLRARGEILEIGPHELAMTRREAAALLSMAGVELDPPDVATLLHRTEGWPAPLYLAARSIRGGRDAQRAVAEFAGGDRLVADYLRDEVLMALPAATMTFLLGTAVLARLSGPACDAVLGREDSGVRLRELARGGIPLMPLDHADREYRYHRLFREMLAAEQRRRDPSGTAILHRRAGAWLERTGEIEMSLEHAIAAGDVGNAGDRLWSIAGPRVADGRSDEIRGWIERFRTDEVGAEPALALTAATTHAADGDRDRMEHWVDAAERRIAEGRAAPVSSAAAIPVLRAVVARRGLAAMTGDAATAYERTTGDDCWRPLACLLHGAGLHLLGDGARAVGVLEEGARRGGVVAPHAQALCLAQLALISAGDGDWEQSALLASRARGQVERAGLDRYPMSALVYAVSALVRAHRERVDAAREDCRRAQTLLETIVDAPPWYAAEARISLARAMLRLGDVVGCRDMLAHARRVPLAATDAPLAARWIEECGAQADAFTSSVLSGPVSLTTAEVRVLRMLPTHLSFREMGARLHVTANTVKTHAHAVYRKLDACSRSEAVVHARSVGLLDG